jgi:hypothetical protein
VPRLVWIAARLERHSIPRPFLFPKIADRPGNHRITLAADKAYDVAEFVADLREFNVTPQWRRTPPNRRSAIDDASDPSPAEVAGFDLFVPLGISAAPSSRAVRGTPHGAPKGVSPWREDAAHQLVRDVAVDLVALIQSWPHVG